MSSNSLHAVLGDDDYLVRQRAKEIFDELCPEFPDDLSREIIDGRADRVDEVERILSEARSAGETLSLFGGGNRLDQRSQFFESNQDGAAQGSKEALKLSNPFWKIWGRPS